MLYNIFIQPQSIAQSIATCSVSIICVNVTKVVVI
jgi:hypothetical protein